ncbi:hypothetical protein ACLH32_000884 [Yersinia ruckeri]
MEKIVCGLCNAEVGLNMLSNHLLSKHGWKMVSKATVEAPSVTPEVCKCPICNVSLKDARRLKKHLDKAHAKAGISSQPLHHTAKKQSVSTISYHWALTKKLDKKYTSVVDKFVAEKTLLEIEKEITLIVNSYDAADLSRQSLMSGRLIILSHAKKRIEAKNKASKNKKVPAKRSKKGPVRSGDIMDQYIGGRRIVVSGGLPSLGKR